jgi:hypothetical protein
MNVVPWIKRFAMGVVFVLIVPLFGQTMGAMEMPGDRKDVLYTCACGPDCACGSISLKPGDCACGKALTWGHVVRVEGSDALLCTCGEGCLCRLDPKDPAKCGCGNALRRVSLKGTGIYFCNCMGACSCNRLASAPAKCMCGMVLKKSD